MIRIALLVLFLATTAHADGRDDAIRAPFATIEKAIRGGDEALFKSQWHAEGYDKNLVGGSGNTGASMFKQGARKKWFPRPDAAKATILADGAAAIVGCDIWSWEQNKAVDRVDALVVKTATGYVLLGAGEKRAQVDALAERWLKKQPLAPAKKSEK
jgi:hypothetical protein